MSPCGPKLHLERHMWMHRRLGWLIGALSKCFVFYTLGHSAGNWLLYGFQTCTISTIYTACRLAATVAQPVDCIFLWNSPNFCSSFLLHLHPSIHPSIDPSIHLSIQPSIHSSIPPCILSSMHRHMYTTTWFALCYGWRVGIVHTKCVAASAVAATAAPRDELSLA